MSGLLDSLGLEMVIAGVVIALAGLFLTPMRSVIVPAIGMRLPRLVKPPAAPQIAPDPAPAAASVSVPAAPASRRALNAVGQPGADYRDPEALFARTLLTAQKTAEDLVRNAQLEAQDIITKAETAASDTARTSRKNASEVLQKAQQDADVIVSSAKQKATAWLTLLQAEADKLVADAHQTFQGAQRSVEQNVASLASRFERRMAEWDIDPWEQRRAALGLNGDAEHAPERTPTRIA
jgi:vacuolar-type H+-ATPase subunit H